LNVGFSYGSNGATNTNAAAKDVYAFLQLFFKKFPGKELLICHCIRKRN
jgi:cathepsin A (carboxypeptidase C)